MRKLWHQRLEAGRHSANARANLAGADSRLARPPVRARRNSRWRFGPGVTYVIARLEAG
jgi:hypothetical protein